MMHLMYSQSINTTPEQEQRIKDLVTPERLIEWSKGLSNEQDQRVAIDTLESQLKELKSIANELYLKNNIALVKIDSLNQKSIIDNSNYKNQLKEETKLLKKQLRNERLKIGGGALIVITAILLIK